MSIQLYWQSEADYLPAMTVKKLRRFAELATFTNTFQNSADLKGKWNSDYFRNSLRDLGFNVFQSESPTPIVPLLIGNENKSRLINKELLEKVG